MLKNDSSSWNQSAEGIQEQKLGAEHPRIQKMDGSIRNLQVQLFQKRLNQTLLDIANHRWVKSQLDP